jgi:hypothetical protein
MDPIIFVVIVLVAAAITFGRLIAARRVTAGDGRFAVVIFLPALLSSAIFVFVAIRIAPDLPVVAFPMAAAGIVYLWSTVRAIIRSTTAVNRARSSDEIATAITEPTTDLMIMWMSLILIGGLVAVAALLVWGISRAAG